MLIDVCVIPFYIGSVDVLIITLLNDSVYFDGRRLSSAMAFHMFAFCVDRQLMLKRIGKQFYH